MIEKLKTAALIVLVALSLVQSYFLAYSMPGIGATVRSEGDYVNADPLGKPASVESVIFPEEIVLHMGDNTHTVIYPGTQFYDMILKQRIVGREFKGFQRTPSNVLDWEEVRRNDIGIELRFGNGVSVDLLQKLLKLEGDLLFLQEKIDRIWIFKSGDSEEIRTFFFSSDGMMVYESVRADLTVRDVQDYVGFGEFLPTYSMTADGLYLPNEPLQAVELVYPYELYSPEQMQRSLFFDISTTRAIEDRSGSQIFTDGKRGLKVEQNGMWINYTNSAAGSGSETRPSENVYVSVDFINQHGGWDGVHRLMSGPADEENRSVTFRKYVDQYPVIDYAPFRYGYMKLTLQQGVVTEYERSMITLKAAAESRESRWLPGGDALKESLQRYSRRGEVTALYPALKALPIEDSRLQFVPVWAVRLNDGTEHVLQEAYRAGFEPQVDRTADGEAAEGDGDDGESAGNGDASDERAAGHAGAHAAISGAGGGAVAADAGAAAEDTAAAAAASEGGPSAAGAAEPVNEPGPDTPGRLDGAEEAADWLQADEAEENDAGEGLAAAGENAAAAPDAGNGWR